MAQFKKGCPGQGARLRTFGFYLFYTLNSDLIDLTHQIIAVPCSMPLSQFYSSPMLNSTTFYLALLV